MQRQGGSFAETAITAPQREISHRVLVDWHNNGLFDHILSDITDFVSKVEVDRDLTGTAPEEVLLIEGSSSAELTIVMSGEFRGYQLTNLFSPYTVAAPLRGLSMVGSEIKWELIVETSNGPVVYPQFVGKVRTISPDRGDNSVTITALDRVENLRKQITLPVWAMSAEHEAYGEEASQYARSHWVIDSCLRLCDVGVSPKRPRYRSEEGMGPAGSEGCQLFITGNGSYVPTIGWLDNLQASSFPRDISMYAKTGPRHSDADTDSPRPFGFNGLGTPLSQMFGTSAGQGVLRYWAADRYALYTSGAHYFGLTLNTNGTNGQAFKTIELHQAMEVAIGRKFFLYLDIKAGQARTRISDKNQNTEVVSAWVDIPIDQGNVDILCIWDGSSTGTRAYIKVGTNVANWATLRAPLPTSGIRDSLQGRVTIGQALSMSDIFYTARQVSNASSNTINAYTEPKYLAQLDEGLNRLSNIPSNKGKQAWDILTEVAAAEFGTVFWDETGIFRFWNFNTMTAKQKTIVRRLNLDQVSGLSITNSLDSIRNSYSVTTAKSRGVGIATIYDSRDVDEFRTPAGQVRYFPLYLDNVIAPYHGPLQKYDTQEVPDGRIPNVENFWPSWNDQATHGYCIQYYFPEIGWYESPGGPAGPRAGVDVTCYFRADGSLVVRVYNQFTEDIRFGSHGTGTSPQWPGLTSEPAFRIAGTRIDTSDPIVITRSSLRSIAKYDVRSLSLEGDYFQDTLLNSNLLDTLITRTSEPIPNTDKITIAGDPRLQLGDTLMLEDPEGFGPEIRVQIYGIHRTFEKDEGLTDDLTVEMLKPTNAELTQTPPINVPDFNPDDGPPEPDDGGVYRTNLCPNAALSVDSDGWYGTTGAARTTKADGMIRRTGWKVINKGVAGQVQLPVGKARPGYKYNNSVYAQALDKDVNLKCYSAWYTDAGYLSNTEEEEFRVLKGNTARIDTGTQTAPPNVTKMVMLVYGFEDDADVIMTGALYEQTVSLVPGEYFDETTPGAVSLGTVGKSPSRIQTGAPPIEDGGDIPNPDPQPENPFDSAARTQGWGVAHPMSDTFNYTGVVNPAKWQVMGTGGTAGGDACWIGQNGTGRVCVSQYELNGSFLRLNGDADGDSAGLISVFNQRRGRWEVKARLGPPVGATGAKYTPVLQTFPESGLVPDGGQYEFFRAQIDGTNYQQVMHRPAPTNITLVGTSPTIDLTAWHNYGFEWTPTALVCYVDGAESFRVTNGSYQAPAAMHLRMTLENLFGSGMQTAYLDIAWARIYLSTGEAVTPTTGYGVAPYGTSGYGN